MTLAVISDDNLEDIKKVIQKNFSIIPNYNIKREKFDNQVDYIPPFSENVLGKVYYVEGF